MSTRKQLYEWRLFGQGAYTAAQVGDGSTYPSGGERMSIFTGGYGNNVTESNMVREDHFIVIDRFGSTNGIIGATASAGSLTSWNPNLFVQLYIDTTAYYQDPQNVQDIGISGMASPYPATEGVRPIQYFLRPPVYVLPEQTWDIRITFMNDLAGVASINSVTTIPSTTTIGRCFVQYWHFDGADALICHQLLKLGIPVSVDTVEWYKQQLLLTEGLETDVWKEYLAMSEKYRLMEEKREAYYGRGKKKA